MTSRDRKYKRWIFLASWTLYLSMNVVMRFVGLPISGAAIARDSGLGVRLRLITSYVCLPLFWGICFVLNLSMRERRIFRSRPEKFLMSGLIVWLIWGTFTAFGGLSLFTGWLAYKGIIRLWIFTTALMMASKIVEVYDLRQEVTGITALVLGIALLMAYITHFNGLEFLSSLSNILAKEDRYRFSFGFGHVNTAGKVCLDFFMFTAIYRALVTERYRQNYVRVGGVLREAFYTNILCLSSL